MAKQVKVESLQPGDIFTKKYTLHDREAFIVLENEPECNYIVAQSRRDINERPKRIFKLNQKKEDVHVILLQKG